jgi:hypothetical protein
LTHEVEATLESLTAALSQHYTATGGLVGPKTLENLRKGYYTKEAGDGKSVTCVLDSQEDKTELKFDYADVLNIVEPLDVNTLLVVTSAGREMKMDSLAQEFRDAGVELPRLEVEWKGELFGGKKVVSTPEKRKSEDSDFSAAPDTNVFASKSSQMMGDALRRKLARKGSDGKTPGSASSAGSRRK